MWVSGSGFRDLGFGISVQCSGIWAVGFGFKV